MGQEAMCELRYRGRKSTGKAYLESEQILIRGDTRLVIPIKDITAVQCKDGNLTFQLPDGPVVLALGATAEKWAHKLLNPRSLLDKLGLKEGQQVAVLGVSAAPSFAREVAEHIKTSVLTRVRAGLDVIIAGIDTPADLEKLERYKNSLNPAGALWTVVRKGSKELPTAALFESGRRVGLTDNKVTRFSQTHTAYRFVIPKAARK